MSQVWKLVGCCKEPLDGGGTAVPPDSRLIYHQILKDADVLSPLQIFQVAHGSFPIFIILCLRLVAVMIHVGFLLQQVQYT